jgi:hypothetical protein
MLTNLSLLGLEPAAAGSEDFQQEWYRAMIRTGMLKGDGGVSLMSTLEAALQDALLPDWFATSPLRERPRWLMRAGGRIGPLPCVSAPYPW